MNGFWILLIGRCIPNYYQAEPDTQGQDYHLEVDILTFAGTKA